MASKESRVISAEQRFRSKRVRYWDNTYECGACQSQHFVLFMDHTIRCGKCCAFIKKLRTYELQNA